MLPNPARLSERAEVLVRQFGIAMRNPGVRMEVVFGPPVIATPVYAYCAHSTQPG